jgi:nitrogen fixation protein FixH
MSAAGHRGWIPQEITGRHVLLFMVAFFALVTAVLGAFTWIAVATFPGLVATGSTYQKGLRYNETLAEDAAYQRLGWRAEASYDMRRDELAVSLSDRDGAPVFTKQVQAIVSRPAVERFDQPVAFREAGDGVYVAPVALAPGQWHLQLEVRTGAPDSPPVFKTKTRVWIGSKR